MDAGKTLDRIHRGAPRLDNIGQPPESEVFVHRLKVEEAMASDAGRNVIRIDSSSLILLGVKVGDVIVLTGQNGHRAAARCEDSMLLEIEPVIRLDRIMRYNLGVQIGDSVRSDSVSKVITNPGFCDELYLEPISLKVPAAVDERYINRALQGMPVVSGQVVLVPYFGGMWYPYVVSGANNESGELENPVLVSSGTVVQVGWREGDTAQ